MICFNFVFCVFSYMSVYIPIYDWYLQRQEEGSESLGTEVTNDYGIPCGCYGKAMNIKVGERENI